MAEDLGTIATLNFNVDKGTAVASVTPNKIILNNPDASTFRLSSNIQAVYESDEIVSVSVGFRAAEDGKPKTISATSESFYGSDNKTVSTMSFANSGGVDKNDADQVVQNYILEFRCRYFNLDIGDDGTISYNIPFTIVCGTQDAGSEDYEFSIPGMTGARHCAYFVGRGNKVILADIDVGGYTGDIVFDSGDQYSWYNMEIIGNGTHENRKQLKITSDTGSSILARMALFSIKKDVLTPYPLSISLTAGAAMSFSIGGEALVRNEGTGEYDDISVPASDSEIIIAVGPGESLGNYLELEKPVVECSADWIKAVVEESSSFTASIKLSFTKNPSSSYRSASIRIVPNSSLKTADRESGQPLLTEDDADTLTFLQEPSDDTPTDPDEPTDPDNPDTPEAPSWHAGKRLAKWQYAADAAYAILYYKSESSIIFEMWDENNKELAGVCQISDFAYDIEDLKFYSINDVVYITHPEIRPKRIIREDDPDSASGYKFSIADFEIKIDPVLDEYADRNEFVVEGTTYDTGQTVLVTEKALTVAQKANNAMLLFDKESYWRGTGGQMLMLKRPTEMLKCYGWLYEHEKDKDTAILPNPTPEETFVDEKGGEGKSTPWLFAFGKISVETAGKWSGRFICELWKPGMATGDDGEPLEPEVLAVLETNNAMTNKSVSRDLTIVGCRIRVRCEKRQRATAVSVITDSNNNIAYKDTVSDTGCYVTISNAQEIPVYLRIESVTPAEGTREGYAYCRAIHPFEGGFKSSSFAEGAWCAGRYGYPRVCGVFQERMVFGGTKNKPCTLWCSKTNDWANFVQGTGDSMPIFATANTDNIDSIQWMQIAKSYVMFGSLSGEWYFGAADSGALKPTNYSFQRLSNFGSTRGVDAVLFGNSTIVAKNGGQQIVDVSYNTLSEMGSGTNLALYASHLFENDPVYDMCATLAPTPILWVLTQSGRLTSFTYEDKNNVFAWARHRIFDGVEEIVDVRRGERDILVMIVREGNKRFLAELDPNRGDDYDHEGEADTREHIFLDQNAAGEFVRYESRFVPTPVTFENGIAYGRKCAFRNFDVYLKTHNGDFDGTPVWAEGTQFVIRLGNGSRYIADYGWLKENVLREFGENRIILPMSGGWEEQALVDISTDYPAPLTVTAIGADFSIGN